MTARREISRQEFLRISGRAAAGAAVGSALLLATASGGCGGGRETALITDFGARGDGRHDDTKAILKAIDEMFEAGGGVVKVPQTEAFYKTTRAINLKTDMLHPVHIVGEGDKSFLKNVHQGGHEAVRKARMENQEDRRHDDPRRSAYAILHPLFSILV